MPFCTAYIFTYHNIRTRNDAYDRMTLTIDSPFAVRMTLMLDSPFGFRMTLAVRMMLAVLIRRDVYKSFLTNVTMI